MKLCLEITSYSRPYVKFQRLLHISKPVLQRCSHKRIIWKYAGNLQENTHVRVWFPKGCKATLLRIYTSSWGSKFAKNYRNTYGGLFLCLVTDVIALAAKPKLKHFHVMPSSSYKTNPGLLSNFTPIIRQTEWIN